MSYSKYNTTSVGKTTFMDIVTGKTKPDEGTVLWGEKNVSLL